MKQTGKIWKNAEGQDVPRSYVPKHEAMFESHGQKIAQIFKDLEQETLKAKKAVLPLVAEAFRNSPSFNSIATVFTFYTFDRQIKVEFDTKEFYVRVYRATIDNPRHKDYRPINVDFNRNTPELFEAIEKILSQDKAAQTPQKTEKQETLFDQQ
jgi:hypothetical protein